MAKFTLTFLCALCIFAVLQVPSVSGWFTVKFGGPSSRPRPRPRTPSSSSSSSSSSSDAEEIVNKHNELRRNVQPPASNMLKMSWSNEAAANAKRWADQCTMNHSPKSSRTISSSDCGENLYMASYKNSWSNAIQSWYDEVKDYSYGVGSVNGAPVGHYTQVVWYRSNLIGCAMAHCPNSQYEYYYVCQYCPAGNRGYNPFAKPYKRGRSCGDCPNDCENKLCTNACTHTDKYDNCPDLKNQWGCSHSDVASWCKASCQCGSQIS